MNNYDIHKPYPIVLLLTLVTNAKETYIIYNVNMTQLPENKKINQNTTNIEIYKHFKYSNYKSINIDLALNPKELETWVDANISNMNSQDYSTDNIKWITSILFQKNNELTISNLTYVIDSYSLLKTVNNIPYLYFIKSINLSKQYKLLNTILTEITQLETKIFDINSENKESINEEKLKLYKQQSYYLYILSEIKLKIQLDSDPTDLGVLESDITNKLITDLILPHSQVPISRDSILTKTYYTYYTYSTLFINSCKIYTNNKNKKMSTAKQVIKNILHTLFYSNRDRDRYNHVDTIPTHVVDNINLLYDNTQKHYMVIMLYYLLDYILILKLIDKLIDTDMTFTRITDNTLSDIVNTELPDIVTANTITNLIKLGKNSDPTIPLILKVMTQVLTNPKEEVPNEKDNTIINEIINKWLPTNNNFTIYETIYICDILYIYIKTTHKTISNQYIILQLRSKIRHLQNINEANLPILKEWFEKNNTKYATFNFNFNNISNKINYALSASMYIKYFETNILNILKNTESIYISAINDTYTESNIIHNTLKSIWGMYINESLSIDKIILKNLDNANNLSSTDVPDELLNNILCTNTKIDVLDSSILIKKLQDIIKLNTSDSSTRIQFRVTSQLSDRSIESRSTLIYIIWYFYSKLNQPALYPTRVIGDPCILPHLLFDKRSTLIPKYIQSAPSMAPSMMLTNTLQVNSFNTSEVYYKITQLHKLESDTPVYLFKLYVNDGDIWYTYDIPNHIYKTIDFKKFTLNAIISKNDIVDVFTPTKIKSINKSTQYLQLKVKGHLTKESQKIQCTVNYNKIINNINVLGNDLIKDVSTKYNNLIKFPSTKNAKIPLVLGGIPTVGGGPKTQKNTDDRMHIFVNNNLSKIQKFILYINQYLDNINNKDAINIYKLINMSLKIFIPFQKIMNKMKHNINSQYIDFVDFYNNNILHPYNIINNIYDVCKLIITDINFIDKLYYKLLNISKSEFFKKVTKNMGSYTLKYNNKIDLLIK